MVILDGISSLNGVFLLFHSVRQDRLRVISMGLVRQLFCIGLLFAGTVFAQVVEITNLGTPSQTTNWPGGLYPPAQAIDGDPASFSHTDSVSPNNAWKLDFDQDYPMARIELQMRGDCCGGRLTGAIMRVLNGEGDSVFSSEIADPGAGGLTVIEVPEGVEARSIRIGLESGKTNPNSGIYVIHLAEVRVFSGEPPRTEIESFTADREMILSGESVSLAWGTENATEVILVGIGEVGVSDSLMVSPSSSTVYQLVARSDLGMVSRKVVVIVDGVALDPQITEFMASNKDTIVRSDGSSPDWIEVWNPNPMAIDLEGYQIADREDAFEFYVFPELILSAGDYLVIDAAEIALDGVFSTGFTLDRSEGGELALLNPLGEVLQFFRYPRQRSDVSFGPFGQENLYFQEATPGEKHRGEVVAGFVLDTQFSEPRGFHGTAFSVAVTSKTEGSRIFLTRDGSEPGPENDSAFLYTVPIEVSTTTVLRARAFREAFEPTDIDTVTYFLPGDVSSQSSSPDHFPPAWIPTLNIGVQANPVRALSNYGFDNQVLETLPLVDESGTSFDFEDALLAIPTMSLVIDADELFDPVEGLHINARQRGRSWERLASIEYFDPTAGESEQANCGLRMHGGWNRFPEMLKKSFRLYFRSEYGDANFKAPIFQNAPVDEYDRLILRSGNGKAWTSPWRALSGGGNSLPRTTYFRDQLARSLQAATGQDYVPGAFVHLYINGHYWGLYNPVERPDEFLAAGHLGGDDEDYDVIKWRRGIGHEVAAGDDTAWLSLITLIRGTPESATTYDQVKEKLDLENFVDYLLVNFFLGNVDWVDNNVYAMRNRAKSGPFRFYCWDGEETLLSTGRDSTTQNVPDTCMEIHQRLRGNLEYRVLFADRAQRHLFGQGALTDSQTDPLVSGYATTLDKAIVAESARWGSLHRPSDPYDRSDWLAEIANIRNNYLPVRGTTLLNQLKSENLFPDVTAPAIFPEVERVVEVGTEVTFGGIATGATVYYTTDGTDPRLVGGEVSGLADAFAKITEEVELVVLGSEWFYLDTGVDLGESQLVLGTPGYDSENWKHPDFADETWETGVAPLGYGQVTGRAIATTIGFGPDSNAKHPTSYFRHEFETAAAPDFDSLILRMFRDDGAIVYLNGVEVVRTGFLQSGSVGFTDFASTASNEGEFLEIEIPVPELRIGKNVLAVELHQASARSSDLGFDLELIGQREITTSTPVVINGGTLVKARVLEDGEWSPLSEALFVTGDRGDDLVVSEVMYHPADGGAEFLEILNRGTVSHALADLRLTGGITFSFGESPIQNLGPGERLILVRDAKTFVAAYPGIHYSGEYQGALANGGDEFTLETGTGEILWTFRHGDAAPWPISADGGGRSLTYRGGLQNDARSWRPGASLGGSPGAGDRLNYEAGSDPISYAVISTELYQGRRFEVVRRLAADDADVIVEWSGNLENWSSASVVKLSEVVSEDLARERFEVAEDLAEQGGFYRVKVTIETR